MLLKFSKYQGTGNDFIMIDNRDNHFIPNPEIIQKLTDRRFGIGSDGLITIEDHSSLDFKMNYFNSDGSQSLCGNGSRCAVAFARELGIIEQEATFESTDGIHYAFIKNENIHFKLHDVNKVDRLNKNEYFVDTGSPHHIILNEEIESIDIKKRGSELRYSNRYSPSGTNVNFLKLNLNSLIVRTYERGVEDETLSCGTGVTACALTAYNLGYKSPVKIETKGGTLSVSFEVTDNQFTNVYLIGPAMKVFEGSIDTI